MIIRKKKLVVLHFLPVEKYPPVMNFINTASEQEELQITVITTSSKQGDWFSNSKCKIYRIGFGLERRLERGATYFLFQLISVFRLVLMKPDVIFYYETLSSLPVWLYSKVRRHFRLFIHYHEYVSPAEKKSMSGYARFLQNKEQSILVDAEWISQTNEDRCELFYNDFPFLSKAQLRQLPNYPPQSWIHKGNASVSIPSESLRIVYVGAVGLNTMYLREFADWVVSMKGKVIWDLYSDYYSPEVQSFFNRLKSDFIHLRQGVEYYNLPQVLSSYQVGVVLYKGHIPNFIFNVPNKIVEYLMCGLQVWYPRQMKSVSDFKEKHTWAQLEPVDFHEDLTRMVDLKSNRNYTQEDLIELSAEASLTSILDVMKQ